jgi:hypothetical protein
VSSIVAYGALMSAAPIGTPSIWNSTDVTPTLSLALALSAIVPVRPLANCAGAVSTTTGASMSGACAPAGIESEPPPPQPARTAAHAGRIGKKRRREIMAVDRSRCGRFSLVDAAPAGTASCHLVIET